MTQERQDGWLEQLIELEKKATPGPWKPAEKHGADTIWIDVEGPDDFTELFSADTLYIGQLGEQEHKQGQIDIRLIAALRNAAPALLDVAQKAQEYVEGRYVCRFTALREALAKLKAGS
jgi:hypothetical protein